MNNNKNFQLLFNKPSIHWAILQKHSCLSTAATTATSHESPVFRKSFLIILLKFVLNPLLYPETSQ